MKKLTCICMSFLLLLTLLPLQTFAAQTQEKAQVIESVTEKMAAYKAEILAMSEKDPASVPPSQDSFETGKGEILTPSFLKVGTEEWSTYEYHEYLQGFMDKNAPVNEDGNRMFYGYTSNDEYTAYFSVEKIGQILEFATLYIGEGYESVDALILFQLHPYSADMYCEIDLVYYTNYTSVYDAGNSSLYINRTTYNPLSRYGLNGVGNTGVFSASAVSDLFNSWLDALIKICESGLCEDAGISFRQLGFRNYSEGSGNHVCDPATDYHLGSILTEGRTAPGCTAPGKEAGTYCEKCGYYVLEGEDIPAVGHKYDNDCDSDCNTCGQIRSASHIYTNSCDDECNRCGAKRSTSGHKYDNACDATCNECGYVRSVSEHRYDNACDGDCNECGFIRDIIPGHQYTDDCDDVCNRCETTRKAPHVFSDPNDLICDACGYERPPYVPGDLDGIEGVNSADAIYLLYHTLFGESRYPVNQPVDFDQNGSISSADAIYLLYHTLFGSERYPL